MSIRKEAVRIAGETPASGRRERQELPMKQYLLSIIQPDGPPPPSGPLDEIMREVNAVMQDMRDQGVWVFSAGLHPAETATVLRAKGQEVLMTDGPYVEGKEHIGGFTIVKAPDLDAALEWGRRVARATTLPIEVRPVVDGHC
jgi:hypothetical protein